jgi:hypothetical protein
MKLESNNGSRREARRASAVICKRKSFVGNIHILVCNILIDGVHVSASDSVVSHCQPNPHIRTVKSFENAIATGSFNGTRIVTGLDVQNCLHRR